MKEQNLTEGPIFRKLIRFSLPMIAGNLLQQLYNLADTLIVGKYLGPDALASVGSAYTLMIFITSIIIGLCMGSGALFSVDYGSNDEEGLRTDIRLSFCFILSVSLLLYLILYPGIDTILRLLQTPKALIPITKDYLGVVFSGIIFVFLYNFFAYIIRAIGNSFVPLVFLAISSILNIVLDIWFVLGLTLGVRGAAWATVIAQAIAGIGITVYAFARIAFLRQIGKSTTARPNRWRIIILNDILTAIQQSVMNFGILMIQGLVNSFGASVMASFAAAVKIDTLAYMPAQEFANAYSLFVSQNHGAKQTKRIQNGTKTAMLISVIFCALVSIFICLCAQHLMQIFIDVHESRIIREGVRYLRIEGAFYVGIGILFLWYGYFRGINQPHISLILTILSLGTRVALSYALAPHTALGVTAIWCSIPIGWGLADVAGFFFYRKFSKKKQGD
ncbi:MAG: MATE family efflux transporter [Wujia sp.]